MMRKRFAVFGVLALVLALLMPSRAFAWDLLPDGQMWAGEVGSNHCATVHAGEIYDAATYAVGSDPNKISASVRVKLSDPNYGGRFYEYAQTFHKMESWDDYPEWLPAYVGVAQLISNGLIGDFNIYNSEASSTLYNGAVLDFQRVLAGEDLGGGGSVDSTGYSGIVVNAFASTSSNNPRSFEAPNASFADGVITPTGGVSYFSAYTVSNYYVSTLQLYVASPAVLYVNELISQGYDVIFALSLDSMHDTVIVYGHGLYISFHDKCYRYYGSDIHYVVATSCGRVYHSSDGFFHVTYDVPSGAVSGTLPSGSTSSYFSSVISSPISVPVLPPGGDWPEVTPSPTPEPPEVPTPTAPIVTTDPTVVAPTVVWPDITINVEPTPEGLDYTELLTAINNNLNSLRSDLLQEFESVEQSLRNIYQFLQHMDSMLERHCQHLRDALSDCTHHLELYMKELFEWLPQQLNYDAQFEYDDSAVTSLLQRILNKIPGGSTSAPTTYKPNPQADEPGFFDWLTDLWHRFLIDLVSVLPDEIGGLVDAFSQLTHYFPFSIPWDLAAMLALFEHEPVTPVFDVPWGFGGNEGDVEMIRVDLSPWDGVMQMVRPVFVVGFCWQLALITKDLLAGFDLNKGGV